MEIDIEKCEFITKYYDCRICNGKSLRIHCKDNTNCYYKQLEQLKAENERLQAELDSYAKMKKVFGMNETGLQQWVDMYNKADKERFDALLQRDKYKQCLDEIKDLCKIAKNSNTGFYTLCDVVMLKINEVKGNG